MREHRSDSCYSLIASRASVLPFSVALKPRPLRFTCRSGHVQRRRKFSCAQKRPAAGHQRRLTRVDLHACVLHLCWLCCGRRAFGTERAGSRAGSEAFVSSSVSEHGRRRYVVGRSRVCTTAERRQSVSESCCSSCNVSIRNLVLSEGGYGSSLPAASRELSLEERDRSPPSHPCRLTSNPLQTRGSPAVTHKEEEEGCRAAQ